MGGPPCITSSAIGCAARDCASHRVLRAAATTFCVISTPQSAPRTHRTAEVAIHAPPLLWMARNQKFEGRPHLRCARAGSGQRICVVQWLGAERRPRNLDARAQAGKTFKSASSPFSSPGPDQNCRVHVQCAAARDQDLPATAANRARNAHAAVSAGESFAECTISRPRSGAATGNLTRRRNCGADEIRARRN